MNSYIKTNWLIVAIVFIGSARASEYTIGPKGINSSATGLTGLGSSIGEVDFGRAGVSGYDNDANCCNDKVVPDSGFTRDGPCANERWLYRPRTLGRQRDDF